MSTSCETTNNDDDDDDDDDVGLSLQVERSVDCGL